MRTIMVELFDDGLSLSNDTLGRAGEKNVVQFSINFDALRDTGLTTATLLYQPRNNPVLAMPSVDIPAAGRLISQVPDWAMSMFGVTQVQLQLTGEGVETRSYIWDMRVERSLINYGDKPTPLQDWLQEVRDVIDDAASLTGFKVIDYFDTYDELVAAIPDPVPGAAYGVGTAAPYDVYVYGETSGWTNVGPIAVGGGGGESIVYVPSISKDGVLTWENNGDLPNPAPINIKGPKGDNGGAIFIPSVSDDGVLSWTNTGGLNNPPDVNLMGKDGTAPKITVRSVSTGYELVIDHPDGLREVVPIKNGSAPSVVVEEIDGGHRITIYGGNGPKSFDVLDGASADENRFSAAEERLAALEQGAADNAVRVTALEEGVAETNDRVSVLEQDMAEVKKITDNFELFVPKFANTADGEMLVLTDSAEGALQGMTVYGKTVQDGTPTPDAPVPLVSVGDDGAVDVTIEGSGVTQTLTLSTPNGLPSVGDVCDEIDLERGVYVQRVSAITLDGTTNAATSVLAPEGRTPYCFINTKRPQANKSPVQSTHFVYALTTKHGTTYGNSGDTTIRLFADGLDTKEKWNAWFAAEYANGTPVVVRFVLATPIETPLSAEEITAFKALKTHYPTTTIYNDESARMTVKYAADTKNYIDNHLAALAAAMVNNL